MNKLDLPEFKTYEEEAAFWDNLDTSDFMGDDGEWFQFETTQKHLSKYRSMARQFEAKYHQSFDDFRKAVLDSHPAAETEQDYFDWELAITKITDLEEEIACAEHGKDEVKNHAT